MATYWLRVGCVTKRYGSVVLSLLELTRVGAEDVGWAEEV